MKKIKLLLFLLPLPLIGCYKPYLPTEYQVLLKTRIMENSVWLESDASEGCILWKRAVRLDTEYLQDLLDAANGAPADPNDHHGYPPPPQS
jgi:hypothetical protein